MSKIGFHTESRLKTSGMLRAHWAIYPLLDIYKTYAELERTGRQTA